MSDRPVVKDKITKDISAYSSVTGNFEAERFPGCPLLDTNVDIHINKICITWNDRDKLMEEINEVLKKYII